MPSRKWFEEIRATSGVEAMLRMIVKHLKGFLQADVCSIYLCDEEHPEQLVLRASDGLATDSIGEVRLPFKQGLVGWTADCAEPVNICKASQHPRYFSFPDSGEKPYESFLGIPIVCQRRAFGVLVVQRASDALFPDQTVALALTLAAQLAERIQQARVDERLGQRLLGSKEPAVLRGNPGAPGIAIGRAQIITTQLLLDRLPDRMVEDVAAEQERFAQALQKTIDSTAQMRDKMQKLLPDDDLALFDVYLRLLSGDSFVGGVAEYIRQGYAAISALRHVIRAHAKVFDEAEDEYLQERAADIRGMGQHILKFLLPGVSVGQRLEGPVILVGEELAPSQLAEVPRELLVGLVSMRGSGASHLAILARALGVPAIMGTGDLPLLSLAGLELIIDGYRGEIFVDPNDKLKQKYRQLAHRAVALSEELSQFRALPSTTPDGHHVSLYLNMGLESGADKSLLKNAEGIGLYRTEIPFMMHDYFPGEEEQLAVYRDILQRCAPAPVVVRTLDAGGDKMLSYFPVEEKNPFLGWRGIRITLDHPEIFLIQLRALLRANAGLENLRLLLPMISGVGEVDESIALLRRAHAELGEEGHALALPPLGVMLEVPAAIYQIDELSRRVDFFSVGSNDLTQYMLAVDRNNERVAKLFDILHPAVLRVLLMARQAASRHRKPMGVCGELAGDPLGALLLMGMGMESLSMNASSLPRIKWLLRTIGYQDAQQFLHQAIALETGAEIRQFLSDKLEHFGLAGLLYSGR